MERYKNLGHNSGIVSFDLGMSSIAVLFHDGHKYTYTLQSAGSGNIDYMKKLAISGKGLNSFINLHVKNKYSYKN